VCLWRICADWLVARRSADREQPNMDPGGDFVWRIGFVARDGGRLMQRVMPDNRRMSPYSHRRRAALMQHVIPDNRRMSP